MQGRKIFSGVVCGQWHATLGGESDEVLTKVRVAPQQHEPASAQLREWNHLARRERIIGAQHDALTFGKQAAAAE